MPSIFKPAGSDKYVNFYTDETGRRRKKTLKPDRRVSERIAGKLLEKVALRKEGEIDDRDDRLAEQGAISLKDHLADYTKFIASEGATFRHVQNVLRTVATILDAAEPKIRRVPDLTLERATNALARVAKTHSVGTMNIYTQRLKSFSKWLWETDRAKQHALVKLRSRAPKLHERHRIRRRLTDAEVLAIIQAAERGGIVRGISGPDRAVLYRLAHGTGFRSSELRSLTPECFRLDDNPPTVTVHGCYTKNREQAVQPIAESLAELLGPWLAGKAPKTPVFGRLTRQSDILRVDLEAAGVPYETDEGVADFHSARGTYISNLIASGASVKTAQELARHATSKLTIDVYAKTSLHDKRGAVEKLPDLTLTGPDSEALRATGTDGATQTATQTQEEGAGDSRNPFRFRVLGDETGKACRFVVQRRLQAGE
jgi:integrase